MMSKRIWSLLLGAMTLLSFCLPQVAAAEPDEYYYSYIQDDFPNNWLPYGWEVNANGGSMSVSDGVLSIRREQDVEENTEAYRYMDGDSLASPPITGRIAMEFTASFPDGISHLAQIQIKGTSGIAVSVQYRANGVQFGYRENESDGGNVTWSSAIPFDTANGVTVRLEIDTETMALSAWADGQLAVDNKFTRGDIKNIQNMWFWLQDQEFIRYNIHSLRVYDMDRPLDTAAALEQAKENLTFMSISQEDQSEVTEDLSLVDSGWFGTDITWQSSDETVITSDGRVVRPDDDWNDRTATLTATLSLDGQTVTKDFDVTVLRQMNDQASVNKAYEMLSPELLTNEPADSITRSITLMDTLYGANVTWQSGNPAVIGVDGKVNRPSAEEGDIQVVLTATISKGDFTLTKELYFTVLNYSRFSDPQNMSDEEFFGKWDAENQTWNPAGKINYGYAEGLAQVEETVKRGNYNLAKKQLLEYYQQRKGVNLPLTLRDTNIANLAAEDIYFYQVKDYYVNTFEVGNDWEEVSVSIPTSYVAAGGNVSFTLVGRDKEDSIGELSTKEGDGAPILEVTVNGEKREFPAVMDTYIRAGTYDTQSYGDLPVMEIKDSGAPFDDESRRGLVRFNLSGFGSSDVVSAANLVVRGRNASGTGSKRIMIVKETDNLWDENTVAWSTMIGKVYSWQGIEGGTDWNNPVGAEREFFHMLSRFYHIQPLAYEYEYTGDEYYAYATINNIMDFIVDKGLAPCVAGYGEGLGGYPRTLEAGIRVGYLESAYLAVVNSESMDAEANTAILKFFWMLGDFLNRPNNFHPENNWGGSETMGLNRTVICFPEFSDAVNDTGSSWEQSATERMDELIEGLVKEDGSYVEATSSYAEGQFTTFRLYKEENANNGKEVSAFFDEQLLKLAYYILDLHTPDGQKVVYGDSDYGTRGSLMADLVKWYGDDVLEYIDTFGKNGTPPDFTSRIYYDNKTAIMRAGWHESAPYLFTNAGGGMGGHSHSDDLSITLSAYGRLLLIDPGRFHYQYTEARRMWLVSSQAHNTININNTNQIQGVNPGEFRDLGDQ